MLRILNEELNIIETIPRYTSVEFQKNFTDYGSFTIQIPLVVAPKELALNRYICHKNNCGIIQYIEQSNGYITVRGCDLKGLTAYRMAFGSKSGAAETIIKEYMNENTQGKRAFGKLTIAANKARGSNTAYSIETAERLDGVIKSICETGGIGYDINIADKTIVFDVKEPQTVECIYSKRYGNIKDYTYTNDALNSCSFLYKSTKPSGLKLSYDADTQYLTIGAGIGYFSNGKCCRILEDKEWSTKITSGNHYIYAKYSKTNGAVSFSSEAKKRSDSSDTLYFFIGYVKITLNGAEISDNEAEKQSVFVEDDAALSGLQRREDLIEFSGTDDENDAAAADYLSENSVAENIEAEILKAEDYGKRWNIGDFVKLRVRLYDRETTLTRQITAVTEVFEANKHTVTPTFGNTKESVITKIARKRG